MYVVDVGNNHFFFQTNFVSICEKLFDITFFQIMKKLVKKYTQNRKRNIII